MNIDAEAVQLFGYKVQVGSTFIIGLENRNKSHAPLRDVMRDLTLQPWKFVPCANPSRAQSFSQEKLVLSPEFLCGLIGEVGHRSY